MDHRSRLERAALSLDGLSVGDGFGERFFVHPDTARNLIAQRAFPAPPWRTTDDTEMAISVVEVLQLHGEILPDALAQAFADRYVGDPARGYGQGAHTVLTALL